ncbi:tumor necrosis factor receptor superfamily member 1B isoform X2 [Betta splendens]|uniref:Tumor necrosis factor receptor superfamily member 1B isoform X2 n=1 Tax=Betta splendens TaxID=158456 RepID=A0A9W2XS65_BETSP|nr:tumor necrosis factor receptor superfamily member 1B isoform X2 [Betta splendens]
MKDLPVLLVLLIAQLCKVCPLPHPPDSHGSCGDNPQKYVSDSNLCCSKCPPGHRVVKECTGTAETVCEPCKPGQYMENWNYATNCLSCTKCKSGNGLEYAQNCSATSKNKCICKSGWYCDMGYSDGYCTTCERYRTCKVGFGVVVKGTEDSNTKCKACPDGTFSDKPSYTDPCRPHTNCGGRAVLRKGNATADTVCEPEVPTTSTAPQSSMNETSTLRAASTVTTMHSVTSDQALTAASTQSDISVTTLNTSTKSPAPKTGPGFHTDTQMHYKVDANGNSEICEKLSLGCKDEIKLISSGIPSPEQLCLLEKGEASSDYSQYSNNTESLPRTCGSSSQESIGPLQSTMGLNNNQSSVLSEPMPLVSNTNTVISESSILTPSSPQPTSPQIVNPVTTSPHVNVNITFHIGNGSCGTQSVMSTDLKQADCGLPFGEKEESFSIPQQEDGKQSLMSVQESTICCVQLPA